MKHALAAFLLFVLLLATPAFAQRIVVTGFDTPESVVHDLDADVYLVSNVGAGDPGALDHNGFISRVSPAGVILKLKWIQDGVNGAVLNGPKGIAILKDVLYVADIDTLRLFNRETGKPIAAIPLPNPFAPSPLFLNDVAVAEDGTAFISDNANGGIFKVDPSGNASVVSTSADLGFPNGMLAQEPDNPMWVTWLGHQILSMNESGRISVIASLPVVDVSSVGLPPGTLLLDGFVRLPDDRGFLVSSWVTGKVYQIGPSGRNIKTIASFVSIFDNPNNPDGPADINVDLKRNRLLVPLFDVNELVILPLPEND